MNLIEKQLKAEYIFRGKILNMRKDVALLPNGSEAVREVVEHSGGVCVVPLTKDNEILLVRQFRYPYSELILEIPAGKRESFDIEPIECGKRELKEETGCTADNLISLGELYPTPAYCTEVIYLYAATGLHFGEQALDKDEFLTVEKIPLEKVVEMIMNGEIKDAKTQVAVLKLKMLLENGTIK